MYFQELVERRFSQSLIFSQSVTRAVLLLDTIEEPDRPSRLPVPFWVADAPWLRFSISCETARLRTTLFGIGLAAVGLAMRGRDYRVSSI